jgi:superfamily II DNA or RNA helicase
MTLQARVMRRGARGGWVNGSLRWDGLDQWSLRDQEYREAHLALLRELHAVQRMRETRSPTYWSGSRDRTIDLTDCDSPQLWSLLTEAHRLGLSVIHAHPQLGEVPPAGEGEIVFNVTRPAGDPDDATADDARGEDPGAVLHTALRLITPPSEEPLVPVTVIGDPGHGIVCVPRADLEAGADPGSWRIRLVRLARPIPARLQQMLFAGEGIALPPEELERFSELCAGLGQVAPIMSADASFQPPTASGPELVLHVGFGPASLLTLDWEWRYTIDGRERHPRLADESRADGFRDRAAELEHRRATRIDVPALAETGLIDGDGHPTLSAPVTLTGSPSMRFATETLPTLAEREDVVLRVDGEAPNYRDVGETLEIGISTSAVDGNRDWFDLGVTITVEGHEVPFEGVFRALARGETRMMLEDGAHFALTDPRLMQLRALIEEARELVDSPGATPRISRFQTGLWDELKQLATHTVQAERWREAVAPLGELAELVVTPVPEALTATLRPYQHDGFAWLATLWRLRLGGILADDMGLGKTVQTLALITHAREEDPSLGPFLVVAPTSVVPNWDAEATRFAPHLTTEVLLDTLSKSGRDLGEIATQSDVVITTYTLLRLDAEAYAAVPWAGVVLDEAQAVKNHRSKTHRAVRDLDTGFCLAVTGTPLENNLGELWALLALTAPGLFPDPQRFTAHYAKPIERDHDAERLARLRRRIRPLVMRRTKELVASELPPMQEQTLAIDLHPRHRTLYDTHLQRERQRVLALLDDYENNRIAIFRSLTRLRQLSLHPVLVDPAHAAVPCTKLDALVGQLSELAAAGHRALVFSQFTSFLGLARERLDAAHLPYCYLDGSTRRRAQVIERFRTGEDPVFLISLKAGGVGLNLTEADYCFLLDPWWNPAVEAQAIARTHRIGQTAQVLAYRLIARDTIEEKVRALAQSKAALFSGVMDDGELFAGAVTAQDIRGLLE